MKIFAPSPPTHHQDCIEPVPVPLCAEKMVLCCPSMALALTWYLVVDSLFFAERQHHAFIMLKIHVA